MELVTPAGSRCLLRLCPAGSREGRIAFMQFTPLGAGQDGGWFTSKKYPSDKTVTAYAWRHDRIQLLPLNPALEPITFEPEHTGDLTIAGEYRGTLDSTRVLRPFPNTTSTPRISPHTPHLER
jgi:hypothetical protein